MSDDPGGRFERLEPRVLAILQEHDPIACDLEEYAPEAEEITSSLVYGGWGDGEPDGALLTGMAYGIIAKWNVGEGFTPEKMIGPIGRYAPIGEALAQLVREEDGGT